MLFQKQLCLENNYKYFIFCGWVAKRNVHMNQVSKKCYNFHPVFFNPNQTYKKFVSRDEKQKQIFSEYRIMKTIPCFSLKEIGI